MCIEFCAFCLRGFWEKQKASQFVSDNVWRTADSRYVLRVPRPGAGGAGGAGGVCRGDSSSSPVRGASQSTLTIDINIDIRNRYLSNVSTR